MAVKTFAVGEVLTASDTNTYLANSGLVYVTTATATSGTSISINSVFTSSYDNYVMLLTGTVGTSGQVQVRWRYGSTNDITNAYRWGRTYWRLDNGNNGTTGQVTGTELTFASIVANEPFAFAMDIFHPYQAKPTLHSIGLNIEPTGSTSSAYLGASASSFNTTTSYDGLTIFFPGTISTLTATFYGRRKA